MTTHRRRLLAAFAVTAIFLGACGNDDNDSTPQAASEASEAPGPASEAPGAASEAPGLPAFEGGDDAALGMDAPAIDGENYAGEPSSFAPGEGGPTLLVFLAHWCGHCNSEIPTMIEWDDSGAVPQDLEIVGISTAATESRDNYPPGEWLDDRGWPWQVIADDEEEYRLARLYGMTGTPFLVLVDADGKVLSRTGGEKSAAELTEFISPITN